MNPPTRARCVPTLLPRRPPARSQPLELLTAARGNHRHPCGRAGGQPQPQPRERRQLLARFPRGTQQLTQRLLPSDAQLSWAGSETTLRLRTLKWQTLQDVSAPSCRLYDRLPQLQWRYARPAWAPGWTPASSSTAHAFMPTAASRASPTPSAALCWRRSAALPGAARFCHAPPAVACQPVPV